MGFDKATQDIFLVDVPRYQLAACGLAVADSQENARCLALHIEFDETGQMLRLKSKMNETTTTMSVMAGFLLLPYSHTVIIPVLSVRQSPG